MSELHFHSLSHLAKHCAEIMAATPVVATASLRLACEAVKQEMDPMFGMYQSGSAPFQAWEPLKQSTIERRERGGYEGDEPLLRDGGLRDSYTVKSGLLWAGVGSTEEKALVQEVGDPQHNLPARSTLGLAFVRAEKRAFAAFNVGVATLLTYGAGAAMRVKRLTKLSDTDGELISLR
jgi:phage gpG-like protein